MKRFLSIFVMVLVIAGVVMMISPPPVTAIPLWSTEFKLSCVECHAGFPKLNEFGMAFKQRGYRLVGQKGELLWERPGLPLSGVILGRYQNRQVDDPVSRQRIKAESHSRFQLDDVEFFSAGTAAPYFSYLLMAASEEGAAFTVEQGHAQFDDLLPASRMNLKVGKYWNEFFYLSSPRRLTITRYAAPVTLNVQGVELNGEWGPWRYAAGVTNDERASGTNTSAVNLNTRAQGFYAWSTFLLAEQTLGFRYINTKANSDNPSPIIDGRTRQQLEANLNLWLGPVNITPAFFYQTDIGGVSGQSRRNYLIEATVEALPEKLLLTGRFELQDTAVVLNSPNNPSQANGTLVVGSVSYYLWPNVRVIAEYARTTGEGVGLNIGEDALSRALNKNIQDIFLALHFGF
ncbi:MAG: hypothetical protein HY284_05140 [Nitrospirae bacterium]|nr:hypothetical protein [Nitrospirota bacterium]